MTDRKHSEFDYNVDSVRMRGTRKSNEEDTYRRRSDGGLTKGLVVLGRLRFQTKNYKNPEPPSGIYC